MNKITQDLVNYHKRDKLSAVIAAYTSILILVESGTPSDGIKSILKNKIEELEKLNG